MYTVLNKKASTTLVGDVEKFLFLPQIHVRVVFYDLTLACLMVFWMSL